jgi:hypothetical protein
MTASPLRGDIYKILDSVLETGTPVEIERNGRILRIVADRGSRPESPGYASGQVSLMAIHEILQSSVGQKNGIRKVTSDLSRYARRPVALHGRCAALIPGIEASGKSRPAYFSGGIAGDAAASGGRQSQYRAGPVARYPERDFEVRVRTVPLHKIVAASFQLRWSRDPFDRLIVAQAIAGEGTLITKDERIRVNFSRALW